MHRPNVRIRILLAFVATVLLAGACSSSSDSDVSSDGTPGSWVDGFCTSGVRLAEGLEPVAQELQSQFADLEPSDLEGGFASLMEALFGVLKDVEKPFTDFVDDVKSLGAPDVPGGQEFYDDLVMGLETAISGFEALAELPDDPSLEDLAGLDSSLTDPLSSFGGLENLENLDFDDGPAELAAAADDSTTCQEAETTFSRMAEQFSDLNL